MIIYYVEVITMHGYTYVDSMYTDEILAIYRKTVLQDTNLNLFHVEVKSMEVTE